MKKVQKEYVVIGLGRFGRSVAINLEANGCKVLAIDSDEKMVQKVAPYVTLAMQLDVMNEGALDEIGMRNFDGAVIAIGEKLDAAVLATIWVKELGVKQIIAKAYDDTYATILTKVGADKIVYPERESGAQLANSLTIKHLINSIELTSDYSISEIKLPTGWIGKSLIELKLRDKYKANVIAIKRNGKMEITPSATIPLVKDDILVILAGNEEIKKITEL